MNEHQKRIIALLRKKPAPAQKSWAAPVESVKVLPPFFKQRESLPSKWKQFLDRAQKIEETVKTEPALPPALAKLAKPRHVDGWNYEIPTEPPFDVDGFRFFTDKHNITVARCQRCWLGFVGDDWKAMRPRMVTHQHTLHDGRKVLA